MLNPIEKFKVAILHMKRDWNHVIQWLLIRCKSRTVSYGTKEQLHLIDSSSHYPNFICQLLDET